MVSKHEGDAMKPGRLHRSFGAEVYINGIGAIMHYTFCSRWVLAERIAKTQDKVSCLLCQAILR